jgi:hypothetical protein
MKTNSSAVTKSHLLDYVTKFEFNEFRDEMKDFRTDTQRRFDFIDVRFTAVDKRLDTLDRKFDQLREDFRVHTGVIVQEFRESTATIMEYLRHLDAKKVDKE